MIVNRTYTFHVHKADCAQFLPLFPEMPRAWNAAVRAFLREYVLDPPSTKDSKAWGAMLYELLREAVPCVSVVSRRCVDNMVRDPLSAHLKQFCGGQVKGETVSLKLQGERGKQAEVQWDASVWRVLEANERGVTVRLQVARGHKPIIARLLPVDRKGRKIGEWLRAYRAERAKTLRIKFFKRDRLAAYWAVEQDVADPETDGLFLGVDLGIRQFLVAWNPEIQRRGREVPPLVVQGHDYEARMRKLRDRQWALQRSGAPRKARRAGKKLHRWQDNACRETARKCVLHALRNRCCGIRAEKLTGLHTEGRGPFGGRYLRRWPYNRVLHWLQVMCENTGLAFEQVSPAGSSRVCHSCGALGELVSSNGTGQKDSFVCSMCELETDRDVNAAANMAAGGVAKRWAKLTSESAEQEKTTHEACAI